MGVRIFFVSLCVGAVIICLGAVGGQTSGPDLAKRVAELEARVAQLERYVVAESVLAVAGVAECQVEFDYAEESLRQARQAYGKGAATKPEVEEQEMACEIARRKLEQARKVAAGDHDALEIDVLDAQWRAWFAERQWKYASETAAKNMLPKSEEAVKKMELEKARAELERIKARQKSRRRFAPTLQVATPMGDERADAGQP